MCGASGLSARFVVTIVRGSARARAYRQRGVRRPTACARPRPAPGREKDRLGTLCVVLPTSARTSVPGTSCTAPGKQAISLPRCLRNRPTRAKINTPVLWCTRLVGRQSLLRRSHRPAALILPHSQPPLPAAILALLSFHAAQNSATTTPATARSSPTRRHTGHIGQRTTDRAAWQ